MSHDVWCRFWDPIMDKFGRSEVRANSSPLTEAEALAMVADLAPCLEPDYRGQGLAMLSLEMRAAPA